MTRYICDRLGTYVPLRICPASVMTAPSVAVAVLSFLPLDSALMASMTCGTHQTTAGTHQGLFVGKTCWCLDQRCFKFVVVQINCNLGRCGANCAMPL